MHLRSLIILSACALVFTEPLHAPLFRRGAVRRAPGLMPEYRPARIHSRHRRGGDRGVVRRQSSDEVGLTNVDEDSYYFLAVDIGTPPQTFNLVLDITTSDLIVVGSTCASGCPKNITAYNLAKSSTASNTSTSMTLIESGSSRAAGYIISDTIAVGSFSLPHSPFLEVTSMTDDLYAAPTSGSIGLGGPALAQTTGSGVPFWETVIATQQVGAPEFSFWLANSYDSGDAPGGSFVLGGVNTSLYTGDVEFLTTDLSQGFWTLNISALTVKGNAVDIPAVDEQVYFDARNPLILGPASEVAAIWAQIPGSSPYDPEPGSYQYPCDTEFNLSVSFGGQAWPINSYDLSLGYLGSNITQCLGAITAWADASSTGWSFGIPFLTSVYAVFRQTPASIGFAGLSVAAGGSNTTKGPLSTPASPAAHKSNLGAIVGGAAGGGAAVIVLLIALIIYLRRRRNGTSGGAEQRHSYVAPSVRSPVTPHPSMIDYSKDPAYASYAVPPTPSTYGYTGGYTPGAESPPPTPTVMRSLSTLKGPQPQVEAQNAGMMGMYADTHTASDVLLNTPRGVQLLPGPDRKSVGAAASASPAAAIGGPDAAPATQSEIESLRREVRELGSLRMEVQRLASVAEPPPGYNPYSVGS